MVLYSVSCWDNKRSQSWDNLRHFQPGLHLFSKFYGYSMIKVYDGSTYQRLRTLTGSYYSTFDIHVPSNQAYLNFITDYSVTRRGWNITYRACKFILWSSICGVKYKVCMLGIVTYAYWMKLNLLLVLWYYASVSVNARSKWLR